MLLCIVYCELMLVLLMTTASVGISLHGTCNVCTLQISFQINPMLSTRPKLQRQRKLFSKRKGEFDTILQFSTRQIVHFALIFG